MAVVVGRPLHIAALSFSRGLLGTCCSLQRPNLPEEAHHKRTFGFRICTANAPHPQRQWHPTVDAGGFAVDPTASTTAAPRSLHPWQPGYPPTRPHPVADARSHRFRCHRRHRQAGLPQLPSNRLCAHAVRRLGGGGCCCCRCRCCFPARALVAGAGLACPCCSAADAADAADAGAASSPMCRQRLPPLLPLLLLCALQAGWPEPGLAVAAGSRCRAPAAGATACCAAAAPHCHRCRCMFPPSVHSCDLPLCRTCKRTWTGLQQTG